jgi:hypothetical protein
LDGKTVSHVVLCSAHAAVQVGVMNFKYGWPLLAKHRSKPHLRVFLSLPVALKTLH